MQRFALLFALISAPALAKTVSGDVSFSAKAVPGFLTIDGKGAHVTGAVDDKGAGTLTVKLDDFDTGLELRNEHMKRKYLETQRFPEARLVVKSVKDGAFDGDLTLKGQTKPVHGLVRVQGGKLHAGFAIKLSDFSAIGVPTFKGVGVQDDVAISVEADVN